MTPHTVTDPDKLSTEFDLTRQRGYAIDAEENTLGLRCVGTALRYTSPVTDAISCSVPIARRTPEHEQEVAAELIKVRTILEDSAPLQGTF